MATKSEAIQAVIDLIHSQATKGGMIELVQGQNRVRFDSLDALSRAAARIDEIDAVEIDTGGGCVFQEVGTT